MLSLTSLPVELFEDIYLLALSPSLPHTCKYIYSAIKGLPSSSHAKYLLGINEPEIGLNDGSPCISGRYLAKVLRYPICTVRALEAMYRMLDQRYRIEPQMVKELSRSAYRCDLPRRIFRHLGSSDTTIDRDSEPLPLLRYLCKKPSGSLYWPEVLADSSNGYPLVRAVNARFVDLIQWLLDRGADPGLRDGMAIKVAIGLKDLELMQLLVERDPVQVKGGSKKRRREDRVSVTPAMLDTAVKADARDIVQYFMEKGVVPSMKTLLAMSGSPNSKHG